MYLRQLDVTGFKCFGEPFTIEFRDGLNVLVGENGAGKTGVVSAVRQLFNDSESGKRIISERDFYRVSRRAQSLLKASRFRQRFQIWTIRIPLRLNPGVEIMKRPS